LTVLSFEAILYITVRQIIKALHGTARQSL
jgi:hypothetical protein